MKRILIGGSPCTHWSIAQKNNRETEPQGEGWELFKNYLIAKEKFKPDFFLYENNKSAAQPIKDQISRELETPLQYINSALVSAQNRQRFYAHNIPNVPQPEDRGILLKDILESGVVDREKSYCLKHQAGNARDYFKKHHTQIAFEPLCITPDGKAQTLKAQYGKNAPSNAFRTGTFGATMISEPVCVAQRGIYESTGKRSAKVDGDTIIQVYEAREDGKTNALTTVQKDNAVAEPVCLRYERSEQAKKLRKKYEAGELQHGFNEHRELHPRSDGKTNTLSTVLKDNPICEPVRIGGLPNKKGLISGSQATRIYSIDGKSVNLVANGGGQGAKTGLYAIPIEFAGGIPLRAISLADGKEYTVYQVSNGLITIKDKQYEIRLADGFYIIRKLTVTECCRLQTLPDDYCRAVSATQAYKGLGNGWTAEVIIHILRHMNIRLDEEIIILSMYDGIGTGRYCLDKMGYKNIKYYAYEIDKYPIQVAMSNYPDIIQCGDAFQVRDENWKL